MNLMAVGFLLSIGLILILGIIVGYIFNKIKLPGLIGMILIGLLIGPSCLKLIDDSVLNISSELRQIALIIILTRSGLNLDLQSLKKIGRPAIFMSFLPATFEIIGITLGAHLLLDLSIFESMLLGSVLAAVSPAVVSPRMINLIDDGYGSKHNTPKLILAGSSVDDIYVVVLFYAFLGLTKTNSFDVASLICIPSSLILGIAFGILVGCVIGFMINKFNISSVIWVIIILSISLIMVGLQKVYDDNISISKYVSYSSLLSIIVIGIVILYKNETKAKEISKGYNNLWKVFEIILFVLVGAKLDLSYVSDYGLKAIAVLLIGLGFRSLGVLVCLIKTELTIKERVFSIISYLPKATVQASIGSIALDENLSCGNIVLAVSIIAILFTASIGAILIDNLGHKLLNKETEIYE